MAGVITKHESDPWLVVARATPVDVVDALIQSFREGETDVEFDAPLGERSITMSLEEIVATYGAERIIEELLDRLVRCIYK